MTAWPYAPDQVRGEVNPDHLLSCGASCVSAILRRHGVVTTADAVEADMRWAHGESAVARGVMPGLLEEALMRNGMAYQWWAGWQTKRVADARAAGEEIIYLVDADGRLDPRGGGPYGHYIAEAESTGYNPWGGRVQPMYPDAQLATSTHLAIAVIGVYPDAEPVPAPPRQPATEEDDMARSLPIPGAPTGANTFVVSLPTSNEVAVIAWDHGSRKFDTVTDTGGQLASLNEAFYDGAALIISGVNAAGETWRYDSSQNPAWQKQ